MALFAAFLCLQIASSQIISTCVDKTLSDDNSQKMIQCQEIIEYQYGQAFKDSESNLISMMCGFIPSPLNCNYNQVSKTCDGQHTLQEFINVKSADAILPCNQLTPDVPGLDPMRCTQHGDRFTIDGSGGICEIVITDRFKEIMDKRTKNIADQKKKSPKIVDLDSFEEYTGFPDAITMTPITFLTDNIKNVDLTQKIQFKWAYTKPKPYTDEKEEELKHGDGKIPPLPNNQPKKDDQTDLRIPVQLKDEPITAKWTNIGRLFPVSKVDKTETINKRSHCTATLIHDNWIIFAAHCVVDDYRSLLPEGQVIRPYKFLFMAGFNGKSCFEDKYKSQYRSLKKIYVPLGYMQTGGTHNHWHYDYALAELNGDSYDHYASIGYNNDDDWWRGNGLHNDAFYTAGYPGDKLYGWYLYFSPISFDESTMNHVDIKKSFLKDKQLVSEKRVQDLQRKSYEGQSGSLLWAYKDNVNQGMAVISTKCEKCAKARDEYEKLTKKAEEIQQKIFFWENIVSKMKVGADAIKKKKKEEIDEDSTTFLTNYQKKQKELIMYHQQYNAVKNDKRLYNEDAERLNKRLFGTSFCRITPDRFWRIKYLMKLDISALKYPKQDVISKVPQKGQIHQISKQSKSSSLSLVSKVSSGSQITGKTTIREWLNSVGKGNLWKNFERNFKEEFRGNRYPQTMGELKQIVRAKSELPVGDPDDVEFLWNNLKSLGWFVPQKYMAHTPQYNEYDYKYDDYVNRRYDESQDFNYLLLYSMITTSILIFFCGSILCVLCFGIGYSMMMTFYKYNKNRYQPESIV